MSPAIGAERRRVRLRAAHRSAVVGPHQGLAAGGAPSPHDLHLAGSSQRVYSSPGVQVSADGSGSSHTRSSERRGLKPVARGMKTATPRATARTRRMAGTRTRVDTADSENWGHSR